MIREEELLNCLAHSTLDSNHPQSRLGANSTEGILLELGMAAEDDVSVAQTTLARIRALRAQMRQEMALQHASSSSDKENRLPLLEDGYDSGSFSADALESRSASDSSVSSRSVSPASENGNTIENVIYIDDPTKVAK